MSLEATNWAWKLDLKPTQKFVLVYLADLANDDYTCWPSLTRIAKYTGFDQRTVNTALRHLCAAEIISRSERSGQGYIYTLAVGEKYSSTPLNRPGGSIDTPLITPPPSDAPGMSMVPPSTDAPPPPSFGAGDPPHLVQSHHIIEPSIEPSRTVKRARVKKPQPEKLQFGEFGNVRMTQAEHDKLISDHGDRGMRAIAKLDAYIGSYGDKYKSHYMTMFSWVLRAVDEDDTRKARASPPGGYVSPAQRRLETNQEAGRKAKEMLFGITEDCHAATGF